MKIIAQSQAPGSVPYVHLGYTAAVMRGNLPLQCSGLLMLALGMAVLSVWSVVKVGSMLGALESLKPRRKALFRTGVVISLLGFAGFYIPRAVSSPVYMYPDSATRWHAEILLKHIAKLQDAGNPVPPDLKELAAEVRVEKAAQLQAEGHTQEYYQGEEELLPDGRVALDGWFHPMRLEVAEAGGVKQYTIVSAGEDGVFGTEDDIHVSKDNKATRGP